MIRTDLRAAPPRASMLFLLQGVLYFIGACFFDVNTVIPLFIASVTGKVELAGVAYTISKAAGLLFQVLVGTSVAGIRNVPRHVALYLGLAYAMPICLLLPLSLGVGGMAMAACTFLAVAVFWCADGAAIVAYYDLFGRTVSAQSRGKVLGLQQFLGSAGAIGGAIAVKAILDAQGLSFAHRYSLLFGIGGVIMLSSVLSIVFLHDHPDRVPQPVAHPFEQWRTMWACVRGNRAFLRVLACQVLFQISAMSAPYLLLMAREPLALPETTVSSLVSMQVFGALLGGGLVALISPRLGNRATTRLICAVSVLSALSGLLAVIGAAPALPLTVLAVVGSGVTAASWAAFINATIDVADEAHRPLYIVFTSLITLPVAFSGMLAGQIVKHWGYASMLAVCLVTGLLAVLFAGDPGRTLPGRLSPK